MTHSEVPKNLKKNSLRSQKTERYQNRERERPQCQEMGTSVLNFVPEKVKISNEIQQDRQSNNAQGILKM